MSIRERVSTAAEATRQIVDKPTGTQREQFTIAREELDREVGQLRKTAETDVKELEAIVRQARCTVDTGPAAGSEGEVSQSRSGCTGRPEP